jgi:hypothetical protein
MVDKKTLEGRKSFAELLAERKPDVVAGGEEAPKGFTKEWQPSAQALSLRLWFKDGRRCEGLPWTLYSGDDWQSGAGDKPERLTLTFGTRVGTVHGFNLWRLVEQIDQGHLKSICEHDSKEIALLRSEKPSDPAEIKPAIMRIEVEPPFEELVNEIRKGDEMNVLSSDDRR